MSSFFDSNSYFIDEKVNFFKFENAYRVYNDQGQEIGAIKQKLTGGQKMLRLVLNKAMLPFLLEIQDMDGKVHASISRGWTFFMSKILIKDAQGMPVGSIKQKFKLFKPTFTILNNGDQEIGKITGDWKAWNFDIIDANGRGIGIISKKWAGLGKELFTSADKYNVTINPDFNEPKNKMAILAGAITIDMVLKESK
jgi:uncharacterized protein YxjI